ncbi:hypothetical protein EBZ39_07070 [bacterium]|nr:hypothetical protein [bacterium]
MFFVVAIWFWLASGLYAAEVPSYEAIEALVATDQADRFGRAAGMLDELAAAGFGEGQIRARHQEQWLALVSDCLGKNERLDRAFDDFFSAFVEGLSLPEMTAVLAAYSTAGTWCNPRWAAPCADMVLARAQEEGFVDALTLFLNNYPVSIRAKLDGVTTTQGYAGVKAVFFLLEMLAVWAVDVRFIADWLSRTPELAFADLLDLLVAQMEATARIVFQEAGLENVVGRAWTELLGREVDALAVITFQWLADVLCAREAIGHEKKLEVKEACQTVLAQATMARKRACRFLRNRAKEIIAVAYSQDREIETLFLLIQHIRGLEREGVINARSATEARDRILCVPRSRATFTGR